MAESGDSFSYYKDNKCSAGNMIVLHDRLSPVWLLLVIRSSVKSNGAFRCSSGQSGETVSPSSCYQYGGCLVLPLSISV